MATVKRTTDREHVMMFAQKYNLDVLPPSRGDKSVLVTQYIKKDGRDFGKVIAEGKNWKDALEQLKVWHLTVRDNPGEIHIDIDSHNTGGRNVRAKNPITEVRELYLYSVQKAGIMKAIGQALAGNRSFRGVAQMAAREYSKEHGNGADKWRDIFTDDDIAVLASMFRDPESAYDKNPRERTVKIVRGNPAEVLRTSQSAWGGSRPGVFAVYKAGAGRAKSAATQKLGALLAEFALKRDAIQYAEHYANLHNARVVVVG